MTPRIKTLFVLSDKRAQKGTEKKSCNYLIDHINDFISGNINYTYKGKKIADTYIILKNDLYGLDFLSDLIEAIP
jgi:hypothetical protein